MKSFAIYGTDEPPAQPTSLRAGPVSLLFGNGEIRYLRIGEREILRRVYVAVRDRNWHTIPGQASDLAIASEGNTFAVTFRMTHEQGAIRFSWAGRIEGNETGRIRFTMDGKAHSDFLTNRTGVCVLHPASCAGEACTVTHADMSRTDAAFPTDISPHQPFENIRAITHRAGDAEVRVLMEGDVFETEDQRNWSDGSFKTYSRPLALPYPYELKSGMAVHQVITIDVSGVANWPAEVSSGPQKLDLAGVGGGEAVPPIGLTLADGVDRLSEKSIAALASLGMKHLRVDVNLDRADWRTRLRGQAATLARMRIPLEVAVYMPADRSRAPAEELAALWPALGLSAVRWIILPQRGVTGLEDVELARTTFCRDVSSALIGGGTDAEFVAINRTHPPVGHLDFVSFSLNPQVHATDDLSLMENLEAQSDVIRSAAKLSANAGILVSPVTLRRRFNPDATAPDAGGARTELPPSVDPRQMSLYAAAWTVGSLTRLCHADFLTYFETHGRRGVLQGEESSIPGAFPARPGDIFPVYHVLKATLTFAAEQWQRIEVPRPLELAGILLHKPGRERFLLANLTSGGIDVELKLSQPATVTLLDASSVEAAMADAEFWINAAATPVGRDVALKLSEYAVAQVDWSLV